MAIIQDYAARMQRAADKKRLIMRFLRDEIYTTLGVISLLIGVDERGTRASIASLEKEGLVKRHSVSVYESLPPVVIVGITAHGQAMSYDLESEKMVEKVFEVGRFSRQNLQHTIDMHRLKVGAESAGLVKKWVNGDRLKTLPAKVKRPDAVVLTISEQRMAIEVERTIKTPKRYIGILENHLAAIAVGKWQKTIWVCPNTQIEERLKRLIIGIQYLVQNGQKIRINPAEHHQNLRFCTYENFEDALRA